jgi:hypothetical protein
LLVSHQLPNALLRAVACRYAASGSGSRNWLKTGVARVRPPIVSASFGTLLPLEDAQALVSGAQGADPAFRAKGLVFLGAREFYAAHLPGGCEAVRALLPPATLAFFDQRFLSGSWYDVMPILPISVAAARVAGMSHTRIVRENATWMAKRDLRGIYRLIVAVASVEMVVERLPDLSLRYFDFGSADGSMVGEKLFESNRLGIPAPLVDWFATAASGFIPVALESAGAKNVRVRGLGHAPDGHAHGVALMRTKFQITWE